MKTIPVSLVLAGSLAAAMALPGPGELPQGPPPREEHPEPPPGEHRGGPGRGRPSVEMLERADTNHDGAISREEFFALERISNLPEEKRLKIFERLDKNQDGALSKDELQEPHRGPGMMHGLPRLEELDSDHSGGVSFEEFKASEFVQKLPAERQDGLFKRLDTDGDGQITPKDRPEPRPRDGKGLFKRLDADGDGAVSFEEFKKAPFISRLPEDEQEKRFQAQDRNSDKKLGEDEMPMPPKPRRGEGPEGPPPGSPPPPDEP